MIKFEHDEKKGTRHFEFIGTGRDAVAECALMMRLIWESHKKEDDGSADIFKQTCQKMVADGVPFMSKEEMDAKANEAREELIKNLKHELRDVLKKIFDEDDEK